MNKPLRVRQPEQTRAQILEAAVAATHELGAGGLTLDAVVSRLTLSKGALLHHFPSKLALLEAVVDHLGEAFVETVKAAAAADPNSYVRLARAYLRVTIDEVERPKDIGISRVILIACLIEPSLTARWQVRLKELFEVEPGDMAGADDALLLRLVADGLWLSDITGTGDISPDQRRALLHLLDPKPEPAP